jgi:hypothetical protein
VAAIKVHQRGALGFALELPHYISWYLYSRLCRSVRSHSRSQALAASKRRFGKKKCVDNLEALRRAGFTVESVNRTHCNSEKMFGGMSICQG